MVETTIFKGYRKGQEVWAIHKTYGEGETATDFICEIEPTKEILAEYRKQKDVYDDTRKKKWGNRGNSIHKTKGVANL